MKRQINSFGLSLNTTVKVAFASGTDDLNARLIERMQQIFPELPLYVVSEFQPAGGDLKWIRYHGRRGLENLARCRAAFQGKSIRLAGVMLVPNVPFRAMRLMALLLAPRNFLAFNENLNNFMLRPRCLPAMARHITWRVSNFMRWHFGGGRAAARRTRPWLKPLRYGQRRRRPYAGRAAFRQSEDPDREPISAVSALAHGGAVRMYNLMRRAAESVRSSA